MEVNDLIVQYAKKHVGLKEKPGNSGWHDNLFQKRMNEIGWNPGEAYCSYFTELTWRDVYFRLDTEIDSELDGLFSGSAVKSWQNFRDSPRWMTTKNIIKGAIVYWQLYKNGKPTWQGHAGIAHYSINSVYAQIIEANYNDKIADVKRKKNFDESNGLVMLGSVWPRQIMRKIKTLEEIGL